MQYYFCTRPLDHHIESLVMAMLELLHLSFAYVLSPICSKALVCLVTNHKLNSHIRLGWEYKRNSNTLSLSTTTPLLSIELQSRKSSLQIVAVEVHYFIIGRHLMLYTRINNNANSISGNCSIHVSKLG